MLRVLYWGMILKVLFIFDVLEFRVLGLSFIYLFNLYFIEG